MEPATAVEADAPAMLNVRMARSLKQQGDAVLAKHHLSASKAIRGLYHYLVETQDLPEFIASSEEDIFEVRRRKLHTVTGIIDVPHDYNAADARRERLARHMA